MLNPYLEPMTNFMTLFASRTAKGDVEGAADASQWFSYFSEKAERWECAMQMTEGLCLEAQIAAGMKKMGGSNV